jgi:hypothetical protein
MTRQLIVALALVTGAVLFAGFWGTAGGPQGAMIECDNVSLGNMRPDEHRPFVLRIRNRGRGSVELVVKPDCGCITRTVDDRFLVLGAGANVEIPMRLVAPCQPGAISKSITVSLAGNAAEAVEAVAKLSGTVAADYWAEPCKTTVNLVGQRDLAVEFVVHHPESAALEVRARPEMEGQLELVPVNAGTTRLKVLYTDSNLATEGGLVVEIRPANGDESAETVLIPVHWTKCSELSFSPSRLSVAEGQRDYRVYIPRAGAATAANIVVETVVPGVSVTEKASTDSGIMVHLAIDAGAFKELRQPKPILRTRLSEESHWTYLDAAAVH